MNPEWCVRRKEGERRRRFIQLWIGNLSNLELKCKWRPKGDDRTMYQCHLDSLSKRMSPCKRIFQFSLSGGMCYFDFWSVKINMKWIWQTQAEEDGKNHSPKLRLSDSGSLQNDSLKITDSCSQKASASFIVLQTPTDMCLFFPSDDWGSGRISQYVCSFAIICLKVTMLNYKGTRRQTVDLSVPLEVSDVACFSC